MHCLAILKQFEYHWNSYYNEIHSCLIIKQDFLAKKPFMYHRNRYNQVLMKFVTNSSYASFTTHMYSWQYFEFLNISLSLLTFYGHVGFPMIIIFSRFVVEELVDFALSIHQYSQQFDIVRHRQDYTAWVGHLYTKEQINHETET